MSEIRASSTVNSCTGASPAMPQAERALYDAHVERIYRLMHRMAGDADLAADFTQETFIRAFDRLDQFRGDSSLATWLHTIAVSVALNGMRKVKRIRARTDNIEETPRPRGPSHAASPPTSRPGSTRPSTRCRKSFAPCS